MGVILHASVFIEAERERFDLASMLDGLGDELVAIAVITASELLHGVERAKDAASRLVRHQYVERIVSDFPVLPFGIDEAREHARIWAALASKGSLIGAHDLMIAATALVTGASVATLNHKEFVRVPGLGLYPVQPFVRAKG